MCAKNKKIEFCTRIRKIFLVISIIINVATVINLKKGFQTCCVVKTGSRWRNVCSEQLSIGLKIIQNTVISIIINVEKVIKLKNYGFLKVFDE